MAMKPRKPELTASYDAVGDVFYLAVGRPVPAEVDEDDIGLAFRYALADGRPCGVTIVGFKHYWRDDRDRLEHRISDALHIHPLDVHAALATASQ